ncbi:hypothetical protein [Mongoliibacter sp.]|uniref:hypothetical protein n=1 Tax=Mongoliibacter sp. TaxID=2022438 RepID=UPI0025E08B71|nr:hypothetical protein [Mongoliibacter sp.]
MKPKIYLLLIFAFFLAVNSCKDVEEPDLPPITDNPDPNPNPDPDPSENLPKLSVTITLPANSDIDLGATSLLTGFIEFPVNESGNASAVIPSGSTRISYLLDDQDNVLLMGFINESQKEISPASTAEVLAYFSSDLVFGPGELDERLFGNFHELPGFKSFSEAVQARISQNPKLLEGLGIESELRKFYEELGPDREEIDIRARQINVSPTGVKSGIQIYDIDFQNIELKNRFRRRTHAFLFKTAFKDKDGNETVLIPSIGGSEKAKSDFSVVPTNAIQSFLGVLSDWAAGSGMEFAETVSDPVNIPLEENESEATYKVRIIGAGTLDYPNANSKMTNDENKKWNRLMIETFALDFLLPAMSAVIGYETKKGDSPYLQNYKGFVEMIEKIVAAEPVLSDYIEKGDFKQALKKFLELIFDAEKGNWPDLVKAFMSGVANAQDGKGILETPSQVNQKTAKVLRIMSLVDNVILATDIGRFSYHILNSNSLEEFTVTARNNDIKLLPKETSVTVFTNKEFTVETKTELSDGQAFLYKWSTSGTFGTIRDNLGNNGKSFENGQKTVTYRAEGSNIPDGAKETISVTVYVKQGPNETKIGEATSTLTVKPASLVLKPDGVTLSGKDKQSIALYVEWANGDAFEQASSFEYKYEWSTPGKYGKFEGTMANATTLRPRLSYQALDKDVEEEEEDLKVDVYMRNKDGGDWFKYHTAEGKVKINNDDKIKILQLPLTVFTSKSATSQHGGGTNFLHATFPPDENYEEFTVRFYGYKKPTIPVSEGRTFSWKAENSPPVRIDLNRQLSAPRYIDKMPDDVIGIYYLTNGAASAENTAKNATRLQEFGGMVEVKIRLK